MSSYCLLGSFTGKNSACMSHNPPTDRLRRRSASTGAIVPLHSPISPGPSSPLVYQPPKKRFRKSWSSKKVDYNFSAANSNNIVGIVMLEIQGASDLPRLREMPWEAKHDPTISLRCVRLVLFHLHLAYPPLSFIVPIIPSLSPTRPLPTTPAQNSSPTPSSVNVSGRNALSNDFSEFGESHNTQWGRLYEAKDVKVEWHGEHNINMLLCRRCPRGSTALQEKLSATAFCLHPLLPSVCIRYHLLSASATAFFLHLSHPLLNPVLPPGLSPPTPALPDQASSTPNAATSISMGPALFCSVSSSRMARVAAVGEKRSIIPDLP
ncbi:hypothetical protein DEU56DRAFT_929174 [Suillus clintonianus]|uniref:uncharacterized protein n=1 Tax=Suillus clintonianus TaxID=1904413 RepID=UPI001B884C43|nr:uncharacterized protein DEU56DRAFT_929174 [Suillus clintonianus]KAG2147530.1 hypothetical protein DEU56DRAFT_929174 [Suillus clintonianus]